MAISFVAAGTVATGANPSVGVPSGYAAGDVFILITAGGNITGNNVTGVISLPSGWRMFPSIGSRLQCFFKVASASESSVSLTGGDTATKAVMIAYRGVGSVGCITNFTATATPETITTTFANNYILSIYTCSNVASATWTAPASTTTRVNSAGDATFRGILVVDELLASAGTSTSRTATNAAAVSFSSISMALVPGSSNTWKTVLLTSSNQWTVPSDLDKNQTVTVVGIGGGGGGARGQAGNFSGPGGGGGGARSTSYVDISTTTPGTTILYYSIGSAGTGATANNTDGTNGGQTWFNKTGTNAAPSAAADGIVANGGSKGLAAQTGGAGGSTTGAVGIVVAAGGTGGTAGTANRSGGGGGGSAAFANALNKTGGASSGNTGSGGGGGGGITSVGATSAAASAGAGGAGGTGFSLETGGTAGTAGGGAGGTGSNGIGGGGGGGVGTNATGGAGGAGGAGTENAITAGGTAGSGGGGGGGGGTGSNAGNPEIGGAGGAGGNYGGGGGGGGGAPAGTGDATGNGGNGAQGAIIIIYTVAATTAATGNFFLMFG